jgi:protein-tyrosine kinase
MSQLKKALEKAKEARQTLRVSAEQIARHEGLSEIPATADEDRQKPSVPAHWQTKKCEIDQAFVRQNRVLTVCVEDSTDQLKILRTQVLRDLNVVEKNSLLGTSANHGEGKTLTAINLAFSFSHQLERTVMLIDADIRKPSVHKYLGMGIHPGLSDYLESEADAIEDFFISPGMDRIMILPGGKPRRNSAELLSSPKMKQLFSYIRQKFSEHIIIFDGAPVLASADPLVFAEFIDGIILVVEAEKTSREDVNRVMEVMKGKNIIGTVLNKFRG